MAFDLLADRSEIQLHYIITNFNPYSAAIDFRRQNLASAHRKSKYIYNGGGKKHRYSNEAERANQDVYDDFKLKKTLWSPCFFIKVFQHITHTGSNSHFLTEVHQITNDKCAV